MAADWIIDSPFKAFADVMPDTGAPLLSGVGTVPLTDFVAVLQQVRGATVDANLFWTVGAHYDLASLGAAGEAVLAAPSLGLSLRSLQRSFPLIQSGALMSLETHGTSVEISYRVLDPGIWPRQADAELTMGLIYGILRRYVPDPAKVMDLRFEHDPDAAGAQLKRRLACPVGSGEICNSILLPTSLLDAKALHPPGLDKDSDKSVAHGLKELLSAQSVTDQCRTELLSRMGRDVLDQAAIADSLRLSERSLRLHLRSEGTSFRRLLDACRAETASLLLKETSLPLAEIAWRLGYSEHSAFSRAARRWFGQPPEALRQA